MAAVRPSKITPHLWFADEAIEAANFYVSAMLGMKKLDIAGLERAYRG